MVSSLKLMERFDRKDPDIHFRELAQLKQTGSAEAFISEFQRIAVMVTDVLESRLSMLFTKALTEPLRGWEKDTNPPLCRMPLVEPEISRIQSPKTCSRLKPIFLLETRTRNLSSMMLPRKHG